MKKRNLAVLLLIPFLVSILTTVTINATYVYVDVDISGISWAYDDVEAFKLSDSAYRLDADGINQRNYKVGSGNELVWTVKNKEGEELKAQIENRNGIYYLRTLSVGSVTVTCSTQKGNVSRTFEAVIYDKGYVMAQYAIKASGSNIDPSLYVGQYDLDGNEKKLASFKLKITAEPDDLKKTLSYETSDNISYEPTTQTVSVVDGGVEKTTEAYIKFTSSDESIQPCEMKFSVVKSGVNVYDYNQLIKCTNNSDKGEIVVLRRSLLPKDYSSSENNWAPFGNYNTKTGKYSFDKEVYSFVTTFNKQYIEKWNDFAAKDKRFSPISERINVGIRVQKDFYGNGYTVNMHDLTYPYETEISTDGNEKPVLSSDNLFRGPLPFYTLGDPNGLPLITAYGQDNIGFYVDGENITVNDLKLKNCDDVDSLSKLSFVGTVLETHGKGITLKNIKLSNGKNVLRSYSCQSLVIDNCILEKSQNFLFATGANEYATISDSGVKTFYEADGTELVSTVGDYMRQKGKADELMDIYLDNFAKDKKEGVKKALLAMQDALNDKSKVEGVYKGDATVNNCQFGECGIASIVFESLFNGPFLYSKVPSMITDMFGRLSSSEQKPLIPDPPEKISGISYPVKVKVTGDTTFCSYKKIDDMDISGLINENISTMLREMGGNLGDLVGDKDLSKYEINIDVIFPLKDMIKKVATTTKKDDGEYANIPVAFYGGGANLSEIEFPAGSYKHRGSLEPQQNVDILDNYLERSSGGSKYRNMMLKIVTIVTGYEPFKFIFSNDAFYGQYPNEDTMRNNAQGV